eukprot:m.435017 g.435017  ORF g.435017 m.435017 type:complete len:66 (-) comp20254_c3_seq11:30-227(-)
MAEQASKCYNKGCNKSFTEAENVGGVSPLLGEPTRVVLCVALCVGVWLSARRLSERHVSVCVSVR